MFERFTKSQFGRNLKEIRKRPTNELRLKQAAEAFNRLSNPTPQDFTDYWRERWETLGHHTGMGLDITVPPCDRSRGEIQELQSQDRTVIFRPEKLMISHLRKIQQRLKSLIFVGENGIESEIRIGWLDVENMTTAPHLSHTRENLARIAQTMGKYGMTIETYVIASQDHFDRRGEYFDQNGKTKSYLLGSRISSDTICAWCETSDKSLPFVKVNAEPSDNPYRGVGGRFEGIKPNHNTSKYTIIP